MKKTFYTLSILAIALFVASCGEKKIDQPNNFNGVYYEEGTSDRSYIEMVGNEVGKFLNANDQRNAVTALHGFVYYCENYEFPDNFNDLKNLAPAVSDMARSLEDYDYANFSRAVTNLALSLSRFNGLFQAVPDGNAWQYIERRDNVTFKFWLGTSEYNLVLTGMGGSWTGSYADDHVSISYEVPKVLDITLLAGTTTSQNSLITAKIQSEGKENDFLNLTSSVRFANLQVESVTKSTNSKVTEDLTLYVHNTSTMYRTLLMSSTMELNGNNLCSSSAWRNAARAGNPAGAMFTSGSGTTMIYSSLQIKSSISNARTFFDCVNNYWDSDNCTDPKSNADKAASSLQSCSTAELRYCSDENKKLRGTLGWQSYRVDDNYSSSVWGVRPTLSFVSDGGTYDFASYFGGGRMMSLENKYKSLANSYKAFWR